MRKSARTAPCHRRAANNDDETTAAPRTARVPAPRARRGRPRRDRGLRGPGRSARASSSRAARAAGVRLARAGLCHRGRRTGRFGRRVAPRQGRPALRVDSGGGRPLRGNPDFGEAWDLGEIKETDRTKNPAPTDVPRMWSDVSRVDNLRWPITSAVVAKMVGGCGAMNAMIYLRGLPYDVARWNVSRWSWSGVSSAYARFERRLDTRGRVARRGGGPQRGWAGPLATRRAPSVRTGRARASLPRDLPGGGPHARDGFQRPDVAGQRRGPVPF